MKPIRQTTRALLQRFARDQRGNVTLEFVIICPLLFWTHIALFTFFDAFRHYNANQKAVYTIADLVSRQSMINDAFITGAREVFDALVRSNGATGLRVTSITYDAENDRYEVLWSEPRGTFDTGLNNADMTDLRDRLPVMYDTATVVVVETRARFRPAFNIGWGESTASHFTFTRPRNVPRVECDCT